MYKILIVEDELPMLQGLKDNLELEGYEVDTASDGKAGLEKLRSSQYHLALLDVMMPKMSGFDVCKTVRREGNKTPIIMLTAKGEEIDKVLGLEIGADDYITKPFSFKELSIRIKNLLIQRRHLREKYSSDVIFKPENVTPNKADQEFLQNAVGVVEKNISNSDFDSEEFANQIFLSRSQLHRKIQSISGQSTGEFIRTIRLKKAAGLILENKFSITQIALEVGFNSPSHFTKAFKQMFECLPSEFIDRNNI